MTPLTSCYCQQKPDIFDPSQRYTKRSLRKAQNFFHQICTSCASNYRRKEDFFNFRNTGNWWYPYKGSKPWTNREKLYGLKFSYLDQQESCLACQPFVSSLTTGTVDQSKNAWKGSALNHIHTVLALVHTTHTPVVSATTVSDLLKLRPPNTNKLPVVNKLARWETGELSTVRAFQKKLYKIWQPNTTQ